MSLSLCKVIWLLLSVIDFSTAADGEVPPILTFGLEEDEELLWFVLQNYSEGDTNPLNLRCLNGKDQVPDDGPSSAYHGYDFKFRAFTVPDWPPKIIMTYVVKFLEIRKLGCQTSEQAFLISGTSALPCGFVTTNGGHEGKIEINYGETEPEEDYQVCSGGSLQGYTVLFALYAAYRGR